MAQIPRPRYRRVGERLYSLSIGYTAVRDTSDVNLSPNPKIKRQLIGLTKNLNLYS